MSNQFLFPRTRYSDELTTFDKAVDKIETQFQIVWKRKYNKEGVVETMDNWICDISDVWKDNNWYEIKIWITNYFNMYDTFEMIDYLNEIANEHSIKTDSNCMHTTLEAFIKCVCWEWYEEEENEFMHYDYYVDASNKIKKWWKKIYWSPKTKVGIKRFNRECQKLGY